MLVDREGSPAWWKKVQTVPDRAPVAKVQWPKTKSFPTNKLYIYTYMYALDKYRID